MPKKTDLIIKISYAACIAFMLCMFIYICVNLNTFTFNTRSDHDYCKIDDAEFTTGEVCDECVIHLNSLPSASNHLVFYTFHEIVEVYIGDELVYSHEPSASNAFSKTGGNLWHSIPIFTRDVGKDVRILLTPLYENIRGVCPDFYLGSRLDIWFHLVSGSFPVICTAVAAIIIGIIFMVFTIVNLKNTEVNRGLFMMGCFSVAVGLWKIGDLDISALLLPASIALAYLPYFSLLCVVIPFIMFVKEMYTDNRHFSWYIPCFINIILIIAECVLQIFNIADMRSTLWMTHALMLSVTFIAGYNTYKEIKNHGFSSQLKITIICILSCLAGLAMDVAIYYSSHGQTSTVLGMSGFLGYIVVLGVTTIKKARNLMAIGTKAKEYEEMAYHDHLTGLLNRTAYAKMVESSDFNPNGYAVVMFDLNDLKSCNDTLGHDRGDYYILTSARMIKDCFGEYGNCYRMGGDEFCALLKGATIRQCEECAYELERQFKKWNQNHPDQFPIKIAYGYKLYNAEEDYDIGDTLRRADKMMYTRKLEMKNR